MIWQNEPMLEATQTTRNAGIIRRAEFIDENGGGGLRPPLSLGLDLPGHEATGRQAIGAPRDTLQEIIAILNLPAGNRALARCRSMRRRPRSAISR